VSLVELRYALPDHVIDRARERLVRSTLHVDNNHLRATLDRAIFAAAKRGRVSGVLDGCRRAALVDLSEAFGEDVTAFVVRNVYVGARYAVTTLLTMQQVRRNWLERWRADNSLARMLVADAGGDVSALPGTRPPRLTTLADRITASCARKAWSR
jgi:hypothetical protein